jgi:sporulation protein YlmC with PRC-barrel domain
MRRRGPAAPALILCAIDGEIGWRTPSEDVKGTEVYDDAGNNIGEIDNLMVDKTSGRVACAVISFPASWDWATATIPWGALKKASERLEHLRTPRRANPAQ